MTNRRACLVGLWVVVAGEPFCVLAQPAPRLRRIGFLAGNSRAEVDAQINLLRQELAKLGWTDGRNYVFLEPRAVAGQNERLPQLAAEVIAEDPDVILVVSVPATRAAMQVAKSTPIVMAGVGNPVEVGLVDSYARPGGNVTGVVLLADEIIRKTLRLLKETVPRVRSVALFANPTNPQAAPMIAQVHSDASQLGLVLQVVEVSKAGDFDPAFAAIAREGSESILLPPEPLILTHREKIAAFAESHHLPLFIAASRRWLPPNGLLSFGPSFVGMAEGTARYIDRVLKGIRPADLPIEQPARFDLVVSLKAAHALGLTIPKTILTRADEVRE
jgi:putative ABC transport system substrate-binding protein